MANQVEVMVSGPNPISSIYTPLNIAEQSRASGFAFSKRLARETGLRRGDLSRSFFEGSKAFAHADLAHRLASDSAGGATVGENSVSIWVAANPASAGSDADYIWLYFGSEKRVKLLGWGGQFSSGQVLTWDLNQVADWLEDEVDADLWDEMALVTDSTNGIKLQRIRIRHSSQTILDWNSDLWLDGSKTEEYGKLVLTSKILEAKLAQINGLWVPQIHWAAREIGKSDGTKYGSNGAWCSEFASWCLRKALWSPPQGNIGSQALEDYFADAERMYSHDQLLDGAYQLVAGDYVRFEWASGGYHSGIFIEYIDDPTTPTDATTIRTIEGNASSTVKVATRNFQDILSVGNCQ